MGVCAIFQFWPRSAGSLRVPAVLAGGLTIWLFYRLLVRMCGNRTAVVGCLLLSGDTVFLLTTCFDWGPVVLQHLLVVAGALSIVRFQQEHRGRFLAIGFFLFGLALWDKALFAWMLSGMAPAVVVVFPKELWQSLRPRNIVLAAFAFCLGAAPLIVYNVEFPLNTFRSNVTYSTADGPAKIRNLVGALNGQALFGFLVRADAAGQPRNPQTRLERVSARISEQTGHFAGGFYGYALLAALLLTPWVWSTPARKPILFATITMLGAWLQMFFTNGAGIAAHHVILLWPFPILVIAAALTQITRIFGGFGKTILAGIVLFLMSTNALVWNEYFAAFVRNGGGIVWTDAINPLSDTLKGLNAEAIYINDWGMFNILRMLNEEALPLRIGVDPLRKQYLDNEDRRIVLERIGQKGTVHLSHPVEYELFKGLTTTLVAVAEHAGYRCETVAQIPDRNGRIIFTIVRFVHR